METAHRGAELTGRPRRAVWQFVKAVQAELSDPLTPVLALGSAASAILGSPVDAVLVGSVLTGNSVLAASQRLRAESRLNELLAQQIPPARKVTIGPDGAPVYTDVVAEQLRPGDVIEIRTHEVIPADARLIEEDDLEVDESTLTGESLPVEKQIEATPGAELAERRCMLFASTTIVAGTAVALVTAVGADTQARRAAELASGELPDVGLQHQLSKLTNQAFPVSTAGGALVGLLGLLRRRGLREAVASGIAITVAAVPEGMPLVATLAQAASARRLTEYGALVRIPRSVEALGRIDVVCFDKTGTLSENRLRVAQVHPVAGYSRDDVLRFAAHAAPDANGGPQVHATDRAIIEAALAVDGSNGFQPDTEADAHLPFRSGRSFSASVSDDELTVKGAPEVVLAACQDVGPEIDDTVRQLAAEGLRVIAVARRQLSPQQAKLVADDEDAIADLADGELSLAGFLGLSDTPRAEAPALLKALSEREVGIRLITGDHPITATAIAREMGMPVTAEQVISGAEWDALSRKDQERAVTERVIFARMSPENKVQVVQTLERAGKVCAMVGDGSNDAAAIRAATVGIAVVARGSDPASIAADVVLVDARIEALVAAIDEGHQLWQRVHAAVSVLLGGNAGEVAFRHHRRRDQRNFAAEHPTAAAGEHDDRCVPRRRSCGESAKWPGAARWSRPRSTGTVASRRHPRDDHSGGGDSGLGDGRRHRTAATRVDGGAGRVGEHPAGSDAAGVARAVGGVDRRRIAGRDGDADQHPGRQPAAWLYAARPDRVGAGAGLSRGCDRRGCRRDPRARQ